jgi:MscS family membrane protein
VPFCFCGAEPTIDKRVAVCFALTVFMLRSSSRCYWRGIACLGIAAVNFAAGGGVAAAKAIEPAPAASVSTASEEEPVEPGSPRATVSEFLRFCREGNYGAAGRYLDVSRAQAQRAPTLSRRLRAVLDRYAWIDIETISPSAQGNLNDGLPAAYESIAQVSVRGHQPETVRLFRRPGAGATPTWVVSHSTVDRIDAWYESLPQRWMLEHLPAWLLRSGPKELLVWQWIAFPLLFLIAVGLGAPLGQLTRRALASFAKGSASAWDTNLLLRLRGPLILIWALSIAYLSLPLLGLYVPAETFILGLLRGGFYFALFWSLSRLIEGWGRVIAESAWATERSAAKSLVPIGVRLAKVLLLVVAVVFLTAGLGYPAASIIAGLGVGGLAVALAAQKTLENLLGAFTLGADQPFRIGDFIKVEDLMGTVETIGLRSTRIRTLDRTLVTIPNGKLSEMRVESFAPRDRIRFVTRLSLAYGASASQLREILSQSTKLLTTQQRIWPEGVAVNLVEFGPVAIILELQAWFQVTDWSEFLAIREQVLLGLMEIVERSGARFSDPTQVGLPRK